jgi:hypothetical protein
MIFRFELKALPAVKHALRYHITLRSCRGKRAEAGGGRRNKISVIEVSIREVHPAADHEGPEGE